MRLQALFRSANGANFAALGALQGVDMLGLIDQLEGVRVRLCASGEDVSVADAGLDGLFFERLRGAMLHAIHYTHFGGIASGSLHDFWISLSERKCLCRKGLQQPGSREALND